MQNGLTQGNSDGDRLLATESADGEVLCTAGNWYTVASKLGINGPIDSLACTFTTTVETCKRYRTFMFMRRITRYVISEFLKVFLLALIGISLIMIVGVVAHIAIQEGLAPASLLRLMPYAVPIALLYAIPATTLLAACSIYGRMSADNEIIAIKSVGVPPMKMVWPVLFAAFGLSVLVVWLNDVAVSWGRIGVTKVLLESVEQIAYGTLRTHKAYTTPKFSINVRSVEGRRLIKPTVKINLDENAPPRICMAEEAELQCDPEREVLRIVLRDCEIHWGDYHGVSPDTVDFEIPLSAATRKDRGSNRPADTALWRIPMEIEAELLQVELMQQDAAADAAVSLLTGDFESLRSPMWNNRSAQMQGTVGRLHRLRTEPWRRWANGFSCLMFALVGAPLAVQLRNPDVWTSFAVSFLPVLAIYYPLMMYGVDLAKSGSMPPYSVWCGNAVFLLVGLWLIRRMNRY